MSIVDKAQDKVEEALNAEGRSTRHVMMGLLLCAGAIGATAVLAAIEPQPVAPGGPRQPRNSIGRAIWPALFSVSTIGAMRVWNAPESAARTKALTLWGGLQGLNALWMLLRPKDKVTQVLATVSTVALTTIYARAASDVDPKAADMVAPAGWAGMAGLFAKRPAPVPATVH